MSRPIAVWLAVAVAGVTVAVTIRSNTYVAWGTDQAAYVEAAHRWSTGQLAQPLLLHFLAEAPPDTHLVQYGFRPGTVPGTDVPVHPLGFPVIMAAAIHMGGPLAAYMVPPLSAGLLVWCAYVLGSALGNAWTGLLAATLLAASPITLALAVQPLSDVPAAAFWALAWVVSLRSGLGAAAGAGAAVAAAIMVRPNLAPLGAIILWVLSTPHQAVGSTSATTRWPRMVLFGCVAAVGPVIVGWSHNELYGSPFRSGYPQAATFYRLAHIGPSLRLYPALLSALHTPLIFAGLFASLLLLLPGIRARLTQREAVVAASAAAFVWLTYLLYAPYEPIADPYSVRYVMPAVTALYVLLAGLLAHVMRALAPLSRTLAAVALAPAFVVGLYPANIVRFALDQPTYMARLRMAGLYLRDALPPNAVVLTLEQGTGIAHYTRRFGYRVGPVPSEHLDAFVDTLTRQGLRPVVVLDGEGEQRFFRTHFAPSKFGALDWPARAEFSDTYRVMYWDLADRDRYRRGERWPTDTVRAR